MTLHGHVRNGAIVLDTPTALPEGAEVTVQFGSPAAEPKPSAEELPILKYSGILKLGPNASREIDDVLYGSDET